MRNLIDAIWPKEGLKTLLDLGSGDCWFTAGLPGVERHIAVDLFEPALEKAKEKNIVGLQTYAMDIREYVRLQPEAYIDAVVAIDVIEHLSQDEAMAFVGHMARIAKHLVIIWTTLGFIEQDEYDNNGEWNPYQKHVWGPSPEDFPGWTVDLHPEWHGERGGGMFIWKVIEPLSRNLLEPQDPPWHL